MKLVGIAGSVADKSYNRMLLKYIASHFGDEADIELLDINDVPLFNQSDDQTEGDAVQYLKRKIEHADGIIIATPEHNHTITASLKSVIEWLSFKIHPMAGKPVMIVGASYYDQGSSRAQLNLRQILESPGVDAVVMPGNEFLLGDVKTAFDDQQNLKDERTVSFLKTTLEKFLKFVTVINDMNKPEDPGWEAEDLESHGKVETTVEGVGMHAADWVEKAAEKTHAAEGDDYVKLDRGLLTVNQLNYFLNSMPMELTYADANNQFIYYNHFLEAKDMLAARTPAQAGNPMADCHPKPAIPHVKQVIHMLRTGKTDMFRLPVPGMGADKYVMHYYKAMHDADGDYKGINELVLDIMPMVNYYLEHTGQMLVKDPDAETDAVSGASSRSKAAEKPAKPEVDEVSGASADAEPTAEPEKPAKPDVDEVSGASSNS
ncbi:NADPH-dependent oxidoreductase [Lactiplantibacillus mudanjiangensis]|uniref:NADPH-dependent oxidoreductase [Lactobacillus pentosus] n=1 Tax=Lactiplantibacillus mudanjiangensis TaxID=1296538 RepID=A0A660DWV9_9LACO|nr:NADPH-dependent oxidoreductase [Lactiplantibacillus mudanjiangensis]VDG25358.1 NADPH-dependent oxidoreductase [Lactobacillus pentosus] [Lactiplantibacillus mudanjiangensis]VDG27612.1 NADPH-dependent oxidoreductase [Lactobacillus pentosus] [Lactiplantibacillus mudanjiangensis]